MNTIEKKMPITKNALKFVLLFCFLFSACSSTQEVKDPEINDIIDNHLTNIVNNAQDTPTTLSDEMQSSKDINTFLQAIEYMSRADISKARNGFSKICQTLTANEEVYAGFSKKSPSLAYLMSFSCSLESDMAEIEHGTLTLDESFFRLNRLHCTKIHYSKENPENPEYQACMNSPSFKKLKKTSDCIECDSPEPLPNSVSTSEIINRCLSGHMNWCTTLGSLYYFNKEKPENINIEKAKEYYIKACEFDEIVACKRLARLREEEGNREGAEATLERICNHLGPSSCYSFSTDYTASEHSLDLLNFVRTKSFDAFEAECNKGNLKMCVEYAMKLRFHDKPKSRKYFKLACEKGGEEFCKVQKYFSPKQ